MNPTIDELLDILPIVADQEWVDEAGWIRNADGQCPLEALATEIGPYHFVGSSHSAWRVICGVPEPLPIPPSQCLYVVLGAADSEEHYLRSRLTDALGMA